MRNAAMLAAIVVAIATSLAFAQKQSPSDNVIRIGYQKYGTLVLLKARGSLEKRLAPLHVEVQWTEFLAGPQLLEGLNVGSVDFGTVGEAPPSSRKLLVLISCTSATSLLPLPPKLS